MAEDLRLVSDGDRLNVLYGSEGGDRFDMQRDARYDAIRAFGDNEDIIDLTRFGITFDSLMIRQVSLLEYIVLVRDEKLRVTFDQPAEEDVSLNGFLLDEADFIFAPGLPDPPLQVHFEQSATEQEIIVGTTLPDVFIFSDDGIRDDIYRFELHKDRIDLSPYNLSFGSLEINNTVEGRVWVRIRTDQGPDFLVLHDAAGNMVAEDLAASDFIF